MKQYLIIANDFTDDKALERRMNTRPAHFEYMRLLKNKGNFVMGGAQLSSTEQMNGSMVVLQFETLEDLEIYKKTDPYIIENVWQEYTIVPFKLADI